RRTEVIDALDGITRLDYDAIGNVLAATDPLGRTTSYAYDNLDRRTVITSPDPDGAGPQTAPATQFAYDSVGNLIRSTDALGRPTAFTYDVLNRMLSVTDALGGTATMQYDPLGNLTKMTDALGRVTENVYDRLDRLVT